MKMVNQADKSLVIYKTEINGWTFMTNPMILQQLLNETSHQIANRKVINNWKIVRKDKTSPVRIKRNNSHRLFFVSLPTQFEQFRVVIKKNK